MNHSITLILSLLQEHIKNEFCWGGKKILGRERWSRALEIWGGVDIQFSTRGVEVLVF